MEMDLKLETKKGETTDHAGTRLASADPTNISIIVIIYTMAPLRRYMHTRVTQRPPPIRRDIALAYDRLALPDLSQALTGAVVLVASPSSGLRRAWQHAQASRLVSTLLSRMSMDVA